MPLIYQILIYKYTNNQILGRLDGLKIIDLSGRQVHGPSLGVTLLGNTIFSVSAKQLPRLHLGPLKGFSTKKGVHFRHTSSCGLRQDRNLWWRIFVFFFHHYFFAHIVTKENPGIKHEQLSVIAKVLTKWKVYFLPCQWKFFVLARDKSQFLHTM